MRGVDDLETLPLRERLRVDSTVASDELAWVEDLDVVQCSSGRRGRSRRVRAVGEAVCVLHPRWLLRLWAGTTGAADVAAGDGRPRRGGWPEGLVEALLSVRSLDESVQVPCFALCSRRR